MAETVERIKQFLGMGVESPGEEAHEPSRLENPPIDHERSTETLGTLLSTYGRHSFDLELTPAEETQETFERWSRHVSVGGPSPAPPREPAGDRDWDGIREAFSRHRQQEKKYVGKAIKDLRDALWNLVRSLGHTLAFDQNSDDQLAAQVSRLKQSVGRTSTEAIKREVLAVADQMSRVLDEREQQQKLRMRSLSQQLREMREELEQARRGLEIDALTRLYNRSALDQQLERVTALNLLAGHPACVAMVDIDHFKQVNDSYGHPAGDTVLRKLADCMVSVLPRKTDFIARYGGEEFAVIFQQDSLDVTRGLATRLLAAIRAMSIEVEGNTIMITASVGLAAYKPGESPESWIARADQALYRAKQTGRDRLCVADD